MIQDCPHNIQAPYLTQYLDTPFIYRYQISPKKDGWYYVLVVRDDTIFGTYSEFANGVWLENAGEVLYWQENY